MTPRPHTTLKIKDLVTGKTMTVEEWKARRQQPAPAQQTQQPKGPK